MVGRVKGRTIGWSPCSRWTACSSSAGRHLEKLLVWRSEEPTGSLTAIVEEVLWGSRGASCVCGRQRSVKVRQKVDGSAIVSARCKDPRDRDANVGHGVVSNDRSVDDQSQQRILVRSIVDFQEGGGVVIADRSVGRPLSDHSTRREPKKESRKSHCGS
jgi:hypothetical protein